MSGFVNDKGAPVARRAKEGSGTRRAVGDDEHERVVHAAPGRRVHDLFLSGAAAHQSGIKRKDLE